MCALALPSAAASPRSARRRCSNSAGSLARITPAAGRLHRLQDAGYGARRASTSGSASTVTRRNWGTASRPAEAPPREVLVAGDPGGVDRVGDQPEPGRRLRRHDRRRVVHVDDGVERRSSAIRTILAAEPPGRPRSRPICEPLVRRESGPRSSEPTTTSTPRRRAAVMNAFARYVFAAISSRTRRGASPIAYGPPSPSACPRSSHHTARSVLRVGPNWSVVGSAQQNQVSVRRGTNAAVGSACGIGGRRHPARGRPSPRRRQRQPLHRVERDLRRLAA